MTAPNNKAPGLDGIPIELWKALDENHKATSEEDEPSVDIIECIKRVFNSIEREGIIEGTDFAEGWMCPIYKKGERTKIANYRPITLLNTDYKLLTKALSVQMANIAPSLIHPDQAGFMKGRKIEDHTDLIRTIINWCEIENI